MSVLSPTHGEVLPPPTERYTVLGWLRRNLFSTWYNGLLTLLAGGLIAWIVVPTWRWAGTEARWNVISDNFGLFMKGQYPLDQVWRLWLCLYLVALSAGLMWGVFVRRRELVGWVLLLIPVLTGVGLLLSGVRSWWQPLLMAGLGLGGVLVGRGAPTALRRPTLFLFVLTFPLCVLFVRGLDGIARMPRVPTNLWGGLLLALLITVVGIVVSFPLGVLLAFGRRSSLPVVRTLSVLYIEFIRGVPRITLLFMGQVMLPYFLPPGLTVDRVIRAMVAVILFSAAYMAENVRGGLQAIPRGQYEAASAIGLNSLQTTMFIILPQALRAVIPVLVGQFIGLFKDTSLVALVGLLDLVGIARGVLANPAYIGRQIEVYAFIAVVYWVFSYGMAYASHRLEKALGVGQR
ncbi:MAG: amino acid ABC transporter permease [Caldilineales bacterium]|nr:amino acid ABC transporter permease [Caldilineales bacterium]